MDTLRGNFGTGSNDDGSDLDDIQDLTTDDAGSEAPREVPPAAIGQDERRMQVRAYNHWASLLGERAFPSIEDLEPTELPDFGPHSVLLDFSAGIEDPVVRYLGATLAQECGTTSYIERLSDVPPRSLLSRITDHYLQIMANQAPIGFEAEFVNQRGASILYRGILLPFSSDDESIDFIYGVINWKEMADAATADELLLEIDQALNDDDDDDGEELETEPARHHEDALADWADSPAHEMGEDDDLMMPAANGLDDNILDLGTEAEQIDEDPLYEEYEADLPTPDFGHYSLDDPDEDPEEDESAGEGFASLADYLKTPVKKAVDLEADKFDPADYQVEGPNEAENANEEEPDAYEAAPAALMHKPEVSSDPVFAEEAEEEEPSVAQILPDNADLHDCLASARELALSARASEDRSRSALYAAVGRAYDFSIAAKEAPEEYEALIEESGLTVQERAPMTPVVKLVFGSEYDKTRLTEYATVLGHAHRLDVKRGALADFLTSAEGGLKGVVTAERRLRREDEGKPVEPEHAIREALAKKLRELEALTMDAIAAQGPEFALVMVRRDGKGSVDVVGEVAQDKTLIERAAKKLVG